MTPAPTRRGLVTGLGALFLAAPAIVRAGSLMPVSARCLVMPQLEVLEFIQRGLDVDIWVLQKKVEDAMRLPLWALLSQRCAVKVVERG